MKELTKQKYTKEDIIKAFPNRKGAVTDELVEIFNSTVGDPLFEGESLLQSAITYEKALQSGRFKLGDYVRAVKFCAYLGTMNDSYVEAYKKAFFDRDFVKNRIGVPTDSVEYRELTSAASRYRSSPLVVNILTYAQVPENIFYAGYRMKAMSVLHDLMYNARSDMAKVNAAKEILTATKGSDKIDMRLDVEVKESSAVEQLNKQLMEMAAKQKMLLESGAGTLDEFGAMKTKEEVIDAEVTDE